ncbi:myb-related transcription factor, partner of profilin [Dromiciops gliroides]|uniref:myb-related transcription factor, partner of profilin n=1 Tax=Dromiciops gliroides TaxID=33562 RepID=UPI001CC48542|nr:myb-related transcription factor, partner of profilin [Dromiciops gliroides]
MENGYGEEREKEEADRCGTIEEVKEQGGGSREKGELLRLRLREEKALVERYLPGGAGRGRAGRAGGGAGGVTAAAAAAAERAAWEGAAAAGAPGALARAGAAPNAGRGPRPGGGPSSSSSMAGEVEEITRLRKPRFSYEENQILIQEVRANYSQLYGTQSRRVTVAERRRVWEGIAAKINGITSWKRTGQEVQKRWNDFKRRTKEKLARVPHSTQGSGVGPGASEDGFSAEEETIFAILGPGVMGGPELHAGPSTSCHPPPPTGPFPHRYLLGAEQRPAETSVRSKACSSPEPSARPPCYPLDGILLRPKERDSPAPTPAPAPDQAALQIVRLPRLAPSPPPRPQCPGPSPSSLLPPTLDPSLDFLRAQRETAEAIRELEGTLRQGLAKLSDVLSALLPLLAGPEPPVPLPAAGLAPAHPKVETSPEPAALAVEEGAEAAIVGTPPGEEEGTRPPLPRDSPPVKRRKGFPTRKRRGRWKNM